MVRLASVLALVLGCSSVAFAEDTPDVHLLAALNHYRSAAGLAPVALDPKLSKGCMAHAEYMRRNRGTDATAGLNIHQQRPELPGASPEGAACGRAADLFPTLQDPNTAVDGFMSGIYHRRPILDPGLQRVGIGYAQQGTYDIAVMFAQPAKDSGDKWPVAYPADHQTDVPLAYGDEIPNPIPDHGRGGYPVTLDFPPFDPITDVTATLADDQGHALAVYVSNPEHPATSFGQYGVIAIIPKQPLRVQTTYSVAIDATWKGAKHHYQWSFSTVVPRKVNAGDEAAVTGALGSVTLVRGTVTYGGMMDAQTAFLMLDAGPGGRYQIYVLIPIETWNQLARGKTPTAWNGKTVEALAIPELVGKDEVNWGIQTADQLTLVK